MGQEPQKTETLVQSVPPPRSGVGRGINSPQRVRNLMIVAFGFPASITVFGVFNKLVEIGYPLDTPKRVAGMVAIAFFMQLFNFMCFGLRLGCLSRLLFFASLFAEFVFITIGLGSLYADSPEALDFSVFRQAHVLLTVGAALVAHYLLTAYLLAPERFLRLSRDETAARTG